MILSCNQEADERLVTPQTFWELADYIQVNEPDGGPMLQEITEAAETEEPSKNREYARLLLDVIVGESTMPENRSFEKGENNAASWDKWITNSGTIERTEDIARTGNASLLVDSMVRGGPIQTFNVSPGLTAARIHYYTPPGTEVGTIKLLLHSRNAQYENMLTFNSSERELSESAGEWSTLNLIGEIPDTVKGEEITMAQIVISIDDAQSTQVYIDDVDVYQNGSPVIP